MSLEITEPKVVEILKFLTPDELLDHEAKIDKERRKLMIEAYRQEASRIIKMMDTEKIHGPVGMVSVFEDALFRATQFVKAMPNIPLP